MIWIFCVEGNVHWRYGTDPLNPDTDGDGLTDVEELDEVGTNLLNADTDFDGLDDGDELSEETDPFDPDTDGDSYLDGEDLFPLKDAVVKLHVKETGVYDSSDSPDSWTSGDFYLKVRMDDEWNSNKWQHSKKPIREDDDYLEPDNFPSGDGITFVRNIPDDQPYIDIQVELWDDDWDEDLDEDFQMDLDGSSSYDKRLDLTYDVRDQSWEGDGVTGSYPSYSWSNGKGDGGDDGMLKSEKDGEIKFRIHTNEELSTAEQEDLAETYSPVLYFHEDEDYFPRDIRDYLEQTTLKNGYDDTIDSNPTRESLAQHTSSSNYLDWNGNKDIDYGYNIYSHVFRSTNNKIVIQYWFFYLNNPGTEYITAHEGDWEMIQIICDENENPQKAGYSQHYGGAKRDWNSGDVTKQEGTHPEVYVAEGGHASYFETF